jgi:hypothetical protein
MLCQEKWSIPPEKWHKYQLFRRKSGTNANYSDVKVASRCSLAVKGLGVLMQGSTSDFSGVPCPMLYRFSALEYNGLY